MSAPGRLPPVADQLLKHVRGLIAPEECSVLACGSSIKGAVIPPGDVDLVSVTGERWIQRLKTRWKGLALDVQIGPDVFYSFKLRHERAPGLIEIFATGLILADSSGRLGRICDVAKLIFQAGHARDPYQEHLERQRASTLLARAKRMLAISDFVGQSLAGEALDLVFRLGARAEGRWPGAFHTEFMRRADTPGWSTPLMSLRRAAPAESIAIVESLLELVTGEPIDVSAFRTSPRIELIERNGRECVSP